MTTTTKRKPRDFQIQCQKKGCRQHIAWKLSSPTWNKSKFDLLPRPIGFCTITHMQEWVNNEWYRTGDVIRTKIINKRRQAVR